MVSTIPITIKDLAVLVFAFTYAASCNSHKIRKRLLPTVYEKSFRCENLMMVNSRQRKPCHGWCESTEDSLSRLSYSTYNDYRRVCLVHRWQSSCWDRNREEVHEGAYQGQRRVPFGLQSWDRCSYHWRFHGRPSWLSCSDDGVWIGCCSDAALSRVMRGNIMVFAKCVSTWFDIALVRPWLYWRETRIPCHSWII